MYTLIRGAHYDEVTTAVRAPHLLKPYSWAMVGALLSVHGDRRWSVFPSYFPYYERADILESESDYSIRKRFLVLCFFEPK